MNISRGSTSLDTVADAGDVTRIVACGCKGASAMRGYMR
jgi:hypothetical protein